MYEESFRSIAGKMFEGAVSQKSRSPIGGLKELESVSFRVFNAH